MNEVTKAKQTGVSGLAGIAKGLKNVKQQMPSFGGKQFLKFGKDGQWTLGRSMDDITGRHIVFNIHSMQSGYVCWTNYPDPQPGERRKKNEKLGEEMISILQGSVDVSNLANLGWEWRQQQIVNGRVLNGDKDEVTFNTSSLGGLEAMAAVIDATLERANDGTPFYFPVIELASDHYMHNTWGKTYKPIFEIVNWADEDGVTEGDETPKDDVTEDAEMPEDEAQAETAQAEAEGGAADDVDDGEGDAPVRRRRRRAS